MTNGVHQYSIFNFIELYTNYLLPDTKDAQEEGYQNDALE
jgi:hypothetical protein